ncbi:Lrp/AsnC family transcriptional regulator [Stenomitos frigidus]|uniref:Transcriptional regulator n=1 Tax=Stenomitos frigidus ULC18 TaxID=2107698 RepID=A0A2T1E5U8_9CYAN|nr:Lrp/AsnC family transcriptional regulator [Stenomitos frigidus]PSB28119.1 transcriptional regulator [Stenomitos frigidus ULC18]
MPAPMNGSNEPQAHLQEQHFEVDRLDIEIMGLLQQDGRMPYSLISRTLEVSEATIRYRIKRLIEEKVIAITAYINYEKLKFSSIACIELEVTPAFFKETVLILADMAKVSFLAVVTGQTNITLEYVYEDNDDLIRFLNDLKSMEDVTQVTSRIMLKVYKSQYPIQLKR